MNSNEPHSTAAPLPLDEKVWRAWIEKNRLRERAQMLKWRKRATVLLIFVFAVVLIGWIGRYLGQ